MSCLCGPFLAGVIMRMAKDYRHCRGGLPDLVVWNTSNNTYKVNVIFKDFINQIFVVTHTLSLICIGFVVG